MKKRILLRLGCVLLGTSLLCSCGEEEEEKPSTERVREERVSEPEEEVTGEPEEPEEPKETEEPESRQDTQEALTAVLLKESGITEDQIQTVEYDDFDGDGSREAFVLVGEVTDDYADRSVVEGSLWYVGENTCYSLCETAGMGFFQDGRVMEIGDTKYVMFDEVYVTQAVTTVWHVSGGNAQQADFSRCGVVVVTDEPDRFCIMDSSYDAELDPDIGTPIGHTWKYYYFFYNSEEGKVNEYAGTSIDAGTVEYLCGRDLVSELLASWDVVDGIFCRGNGMIVINYEYKQGETTHFSHYIYDFTDECFMDDYGNVLDEAEPQAGQCVPSICPAIASYPEVPGPGDIVWYGEE